MPTVSVIVPNYNHAPYLRQRIDSILNQTYQDFELILLDDCSTDNSREVLESYRDDRHVSQILYNETNGGSPFSQWNKGITLASGEWVWVAESDDYAEPHFLERLIDETSHVPDCVLAFCATRWVDSDGNELWPTETDNSTKTYYGADFVRKRLSGCNSIANVSQCVFHREAYRPEDHPKYDWMRLCGDWMFYILLAERGSVLEVSELLSNYRQHHTNTSDSAEHRGLTFIEGSEVLDCMKRKFHLKPRDYANAWGRLWARYRRQYDFSRETNRKVWKTMLRNHPETIPYYLLHEAANIGKNINNI